MKPARQILILGGGMFGLAAALELRRRGWEVTLIEPGRIPRDTAASADISKVVRMDYGTDEIHTAMGEAALAGWDRWNAEWGAKLYHEDGFLVLSREVMKPGGFEHDSFQFLQRRGHRLERMEQALLKERFPRWANAGYVDGYFNPRGGWAESRSVTAKLAETVQRAGVEVLEETGFGRWITAGSRINGIITGAGEMLLADCVLVAAGAWTPTLLPNLSGVMWATRQPVLRFQVSDVPEWQAPRFPVWAADIARTGWYGFPALADGTLKFANHGPGRRVHPDAPRDVLAEEVELGRAFLRETFREIATALLIHSLSCLYCDTFDGRFWIDHDPEHPGLIVAAGDSGHAFKFAPVMGGIIADVVERKPNPFAARFAWRTKPDERANESARWTGE